MIFITAGTQLAFDRLIVESLNAMVELGVDEEIIIQAKKSNWLLADIEYSNLNVTVYESLDKESFEDLFISANFIISHAGMGGIFKALDFCKDIILFPRLHKLKEHRNNHQVDTCHSFSGVFDNVYFAHDKNEIINIVESLQMKKSDNIIEDNFVLNKRKEFLEKLEEALVNAEF